MGKAKKGHVIMAPFSTWKRTGEFSCGYSRQVAENLVLVPTLAGSFGGFCGIEKQGDVKAKREKQIFSNRDNLRTKLMQFEKES